jgi:cytochrome c biogenesis protein CcmG/thiol:disulfide interchange protein DsbE
MTSVIDGGRGAGTPDEPDPSETDGGRAGGRHLARTIAIAVGVVLVLFIGLLATRQPDAERFGANPMVGRAVPKVEGTTMDGSTIDIDTLRGKWVVVNFFATWCAPCIVEHPELVRFSEEHAEAGDAVVVSVAYEEEAERLREFFADEGGDWPVVVGDDARTALEFGVTGVPESFVVSPAGQIVAHFRGVTADGLDAVIADGQRLTGGTTP